MYSLFHSSQGPIKDRFYSSSAEDEDGDDAPWVDGGKSDVRDGKKRPFEQFNFAQEPLE